MTLVVELVVDLAGETLLGGGGLVGMNTGNPTSPSSSSSSSGLAVVLRLSSMRSVSTNPLKFCLALSLCRLITVMSVSSNTCSEGTLASEGTSEKGMMLLSSESSMTPLAALAFSSLLWWSGRSR